MPVPDLRFIGSCGPTEIEDQIVPNWITIALDYFRSAGYLGDPDPRQTPSNPVRPRKTENNSKQKLGKNPVKLGYSR